ncbi:hypothetical protein [Roseospira navarrensis]|uniref:Uncharacterized protein n=1 Tax=Roseospira navarrensis TaxID=140058 RepID=A0A7X1ZGH7_9PROT|nr:hypothetical protein [Roseospira navarrensis]MQX36810.1 hypothetical protein [Roseospira navarrensis]
MAEVKISALTQRPTPTESDQVAVVAAGATWRATVAALWAAVSSAWGRSMALAADAAAGRTLLGLGSAATTDASAYATAAQGAAADSAVQPGDLGTAATTDASAYATAAQGALADSAVQPGALATVATTGAYGDLTGRPTLGTAAATAATDYATAAQGAAADTAIQPGANATLALIDYTLARFAVTAASVGAAHTVSLADGEYQALTLTADTALTLPDPPAGRGYSITLRLIQDATGGRTPTLQQADATAAKWVGAAAPTWQTTAGAGDLVAVTHDGADLIVTHIGSVS